MLTFTNTCLSDKVKNLLSEYKKRKGWWCVSDLQHGLGTGSMRVWVFQSPVVPFFMWFFLAVLVSATMQF